MNNNIPILLQRNIIMEIKILFLERDLKFLKVREEKAVQNQVTTEQVDLTIKANHL